MRTALICVLTAGLLPYFWTAVAKVLGPRYDNRNVREWQSRLTGVALRAHQAHLNAFEAFPLFAAAVLAAIFTHATPTRMVMLSVAFIAARVLHGVAFLADIHWLRSLLWFAGFACAVLILLQAVAFAS
jgi:uncharacterized MAPEG superfamily protein